APGLHRIDVFDAAREAEVLDGLHDEARAFVEAAEVVIEANDVGAVLAELHVAGRRDAHGSLCISGHFLSVEVNSAILRPEDLVLPAADLGTPFLSVFVEHAACFLRVYE